jgi:hypothetical protein
LLGSGSALRADDTPEISAVSAHASTDYVRTKQADGSYPRETYAFGRGGIWGAAMHDASMEKLDFMQVARTIAVPLAAQNYVPAHDPQQTNLLIMVYWGMTTGTGDASGSVAYQNLQASQAQTSNAQEAAWAQVNMENHQRDKADAQNAGLLGYDSEDVIGTDYGRNLAMTAMHGRVQDLTEDVEENRYFVVLMAYDFPLLLKEKKHKLVWETRFSIRQRGNDFDQQLAAMAQYASRYFGQDSHGIVRKPLPETSVKLGDIKYLGDEPEKK